MVVLSVLLNLNQISLNWELTVCCVAEHSEYAYQICKCFLKKEQDKTNISILENYTRRLVQSDCTSDQPFL
jgi:hypothetical protein